MNQHKIIPLFLISILVSLALACSTSALSGESTATPDAQATIDFAISATNSAQTDIQATIDNALAATTTAQPPTQTPEPAVEYITMTEEELETLINQAVEEAITSTNQASTATSEVVYDDTISQEEYEYIQTYVYDAEEAVYYAMELIDAYYGIYGELAYETVELLVAVEEDLEMMATSIYSMTEVLVDVEKALAEGVELATETIEQLETAALTVATNLNQTQAQLQDWTVQSQTARQDRVNAISAIEPNHIPENLPDTLREAFTFVDQVRASLADNKFSFEELSTIAQLGANLSEGFQRNGGEKFQGFSGKVEGITLELAQGKLPQARDSIGSFETSLGKRPEGLPDPGNILPQPGGGNLPKPGGGNLPSPSGGGGSLLPGK